VKLWSERLELVAATPELLRAERRGPAALAPLLEVAVPEVWPPPLNGEETLLYTLAFLEGGPGREGWMSWYFVRREGRVLLGQGGFAGRPSGGMVEIGYSLLEGHQGHGYATEAVRRLVEHAFSFEEVQVVTAQTFPDLRPSIRVLERLGFRLEGPGSELGAIRYVLRRSRGLP
jgi:[ribosomal protein S5]-alanine N-acetyltransferase